MPYYRITFKKDGRIASGIKLIESSHAEVYQDYLMQLNRRYGYGRIEDYDCVILWEGSKEVKDWIEKNARP